MRTLVLLKLSTLQTFVWCEREISYIESLMEKFLFWQHILYVTTFILSLVHILFFIIFNLFYSLAVNPSPSKSSFQQFLIPFLPSPISMRMSPHTLTPPYSLGLNFGEREFINSMSHRKTGHQVEGWGCHRTVKNSDSELFLSKRTAGTKNGEETEGLTARL